MSGCGLPGKARDGTLLRVDDVLEVLADRLHVAQVVMSLEHACVAPVGRRANPAQLACCGFARTKKVLCGRRLTAGSSI